MSRAFLLGCFLALVGCTPSESTRNYRGWTDPVVIRGEDIEAVVIPSIGRIMDIRRPGESTGVLWQNPDLLGQAVQPNAKAWTNFGGDKTWPAPEGVWMKDATGKWMPPVVFDQSALRVRVTEAGVLLESPVDPRSGVRFTRLIRPAGFRTLAVTTTYTKVQGPPVQIAVWVITQLAEPRAIATTAKAGRQPLNPMFGPLKGIEIENGILYWKRFPDVCSKIGTDGHALAWVGDKHTLLIAATPGETTGSFPDDGCSAEIYVSPDPWAYVELETLGRIATLGIGDTSSCTNTYRLDDVRAGETPKAAAARLLRPTK
jgi:hypothetical protein